MEMFIKPPFRGTFNPESNNGPQVQDQISHGNYEDIKTLLYSPVGENQENYATGP